MSRRLPVPQLLRALARAGPGGGGTMPIPVAWAAAASAAEAPGASRTASQQHPHQHQHPWLLPSPLSQPRAFASQRGPSFLDPQGRRAVKQKRQAKQRQRLLREMKGGSSVVAVGGAGDAVAAAAATATPVRRAAAAAAAPATAGAAEAAPASAGAASPAGAGEAGSGRPRTAASPAAAATPAAAAAASAPLDDDDDDAAAGPGPVPLEMQRERSSWLPGWMRGILPESMGGGGFGGGGGGRARRRRQQQQQEQQQQEPGAAAAADNAANTDDGDDGRYANLEKYRDLGLEAFLQHQAEQSDDAPPPPKPAPARNVPPLSPLRHAHQAAESRRVLHYRARHHVRIVEALREDERASVEADPRAAVARTRLLRSVAARTGYSPGQVADCLRAYEALRFRVNALCDWRASGKRMPRTQAELSGVVERARRAREGQDLAVLLAERRTPGEACPLRPGHLSALGGRRRAVCPQTRLPYGECCGALEVGGGGEAAAGRQRARVAATR